jgi:hypothetical protein
MYYMLLLTKQMHCFRIHRELLPLQIAPATKHADIHGPPCLIKLRLE